MYVCIVQKRLESDICPACMNHSGTQWEKNTAQFTKNLRKNPKFSISFFTKFILSLSKVKVHIFIDFYM